MSAIAVIGTLDTKGAEFHFLKEQIEKNGYKAVVIDCGVLGQPTFQPEITREEVARMGGSSLQELIESNQVGSSLDVMARGASLLVRRLYDCGEIAGAISLGGGQGTFLGMTAMSLLPIGVPKVMVSTLAMVVKELFAGGKDTMIVDPIVDVSGLNAMLKASLVRAAGAVCGMVQQGAVSLKERRPVIGATMYGVTTKCVDMIREYLDEAGYELWVFHSTGIGGANMEQLAEAGHLDGVIDLTTAEVSQTILGGTCATVPTRLETAGKKGLPQVVSVGGVDVVNFLGEESVPERYRNQGRKFHMHNPTTTLMRSNAEEAVEIARTMARKLNAAAGPVKVILPLKGISEYDKEGGVWYDPDADEALFRTLKQELDGRIEVVEVDQHINDRAFARRAAQLMIGMIERE